MFCRCDSGIVQTTDESQRRVASRLPGERVSASRAAIASSASLRSAWAGGTPALRWLFLTSIGIPDGVAALASGQDQVQPAIIVEIDGFQIIGLLLVANVDVVSSE